MLLSVCIPTYNGEKFLAACLDSILNQSFKDFEIIICDDCSTDSTVSIIKSYQAKDPRIKLYVNETNLGLVGNWNRCVELAKGEWIKFIFQDDIIVSDCLEVMLSAVTEVTKMVVSEREFIFEADISAYVKSLYDKLDRLSKWFGDKEAVFVGARELSVIARNQLPGNFIGEPSSVMIRRSGFGEFGEFSQDIMQICDLEYWLRLGTKYGLVYIPQRLVKFRVHGSSATQKNNTQKFFTAVHLDKLILINMLLYDPAYSDFRGYNSRYDLFKLKVYYTYSIFHAKKFLRKNDANGALKNKFLSEKKKFKGLDINAAMTIFYTGIDLSFRTVGKIRSLLKEK